MTPTTCVQTLETASAPADLESCASAGVGGVEVVFVSTPHGDAAPVLGRHLDDGAGVTDLSADFRFFADAFAGGHGQHPHPELLPAAGGLTHDYITLNAEYST